MYSAIEVTLGCAMGLFDALGVQNLHVDLSSSKGHSVNDGIEPEFCNLQYIKMEDII